LDSFFKTIAWFIDEWSTLVNGEFLDPTISQGLLVLFTGESIISWALEWIKEITNEIKSPKNIRKKYCVFFQTSK
jgi:hypothetical protein